MKTIIMGMEMVTGNGYEPPLGAAKSTDACRRAQVKKAVVVESCMFVDGARCRLFQRRVILIYQSRE